MVRFIVRRLFQVIPVLLGLSILVFFWVRALPGSPADALLGERGNPALTKKINHQYGLDRPIPVQYVKYVQTTLHGDFGTSLITNRPVTTEIRNRFPATFELTMGAMVFAIFLGIPMGFFSAKRYGGWFDNFGLVGSLVGISIPVFVLGLYLKYVFSVRLGWLPSIGRETVTADYKHPTGFYMLDGFLERNPQQIWDAFTHLLLPAIALGTIPLAIVTRITRASVLDVQNEDYVRTARAKGMPPSVVDRRHVLRNALLPVSTVIGLQIGLLLSGAVLTETIFAWPGLGFWLKEAIFNKDYPAIQGGILFVAFVFVFVNLIVDLSYALINPRIRLS